MIICNNLPGLPVASPGISWQALDRGPFKQTSKRRRVAADGASEDELDAGVGVLALERALARQLLLLRAGRALWQRAGALRILAEARVLRSIAWVVETLQRGCG